MIGMEMGCDKAKMSCLSWTLLGVADTKCHIQFFQTPISTDYKSQLHHFDALEQQTKHSLEKLIASTLTPVLMNQIFVIQNMHFRLNPSLGEIFAP